MTRFAPRLYAGALALVLLGMSSVAFAFTYTTIDAPSAILTSAHGINKAGQVVGYYVDGARKYHGFLRNADGTFTTIEGPGGVYAAAYGINDAG
jgi:probable HAF family extracellular repeat protein